MLLRHSLSRQQVWLPALTSAGLAGPHFHDLRNSGNTLAVSAAASLRELMEHMGHATTRAAMIYLGGTTPRRCAELQRRTSRASETAEAVAL